MTLVAMFGLEGVRRQMLAAMDIPPLMKIDTNSRSVIDDTICPAKELGIDVGDSPPAKETLRGPDNVDDARSDSNSEKSEDDNNWVFDQWYRSLARTEKGKILPVIHNVTTILENDKQWHEVLAYCEFSNRVLKRQPPPFPQAELGEWTDADTARMRIWLGQRYGIAPRAADVDDAVMVIASANKFHPVRDYLRSLTWDGNYRLDGWLETYLGAAAMDDDEHAKLYESQYIALAGSFWMIGAVARVMRPPVKMDYVIILEGLQGLGKSTALKILGGDWFSDTYFALGDKDGYQQMQGIWIYELAELDALNKAESTRIKQFLGAREDRYRPSYGRRAQNFVRQCVFAGTTNPAGGYLKDATGNRRFWPVMCKAADFDALQRDRDQLWAEAFLRFESGHHWWPQDIHRSIFADEQEKRFDEDAWESLVDRWLRDVLNRGASHSTADVMCGALRMEPAQIKPPEQRRVAAILARLGWTPYRPGSGNSRERKYRPPPDWCK